MQTRNKLKAELLVDRIGELVCGPPTASPLRGAALNHLVRVKDAAIAVADGKIIAAGQRDEVVQKVAVDQSTKRLNAEGRLATPGLIDPHTHLVFAGNRANELIMRSQGKSYEDIAAAGGGILASVKATREATFEELVQLARLRLKRSREHGTTSCEIKTGYGLDTASELKLLKVIIHLAQIERTRITATFLAAHAVPVGKTSEQYTGEIIKDMLPAVAKLVDEENRSGKAALVSLRSTKDQFRRCFVDVFCDRGYFSVEESRRILQAGKKLGLSPRIHADEFANLGATRLGIELEALAVDHLLKISEEEIALLARSNTAAVLLPGTSFYLNLKDHAPARALIDQGAWVCLGSDFNPGSCHIFSLPFIFGLANLNLHMTVAEALNALTINAAFLLGLGDQVGQIQEGYRADIVIYDLNCLEEIAYNIGFNPVATTIIDGEVVFDGGHLSV